MERARLSVKPTSRMVLMRVAVNWMFSVRWSNQPNLDHRDGNNCDQPHIASRVQRDWPEQGLLAR
jgi:hypothetical protein